MEDNEKKRALGRTKPHRAGRIIMTTIYIILASIIVLIGALLLMSSGKQIQFVDENGETLPNSISEKIYVNINGVEQGMFIKSKDTANPVLLFVHGGMPEYFLTRSYPTGLEDNFTVVWWEQRGAGISYSADLPRESLSLEQVISDTIAVTNYLRDRFQKEKIYLMGHSHGTFIAIQTAAQAPELYHAYIGVAQMGDQLESEKQAYEYMLQKFKENGNNKMVKKLEAAPVTDAGGTPREYLVLRDTGMHSLGIGTTRDMKSVITGIFFPSWVNPEFTFSEKLKTWQAKARSGVSFLWDDMLSTTMADVVPQLEIPVYFFHGVYDYTCTYAEAKTFFEQLNAPVKGFYTFDQSAHSPVMEEPQKARKIMLEDVLKGTNNLADIK